MRMLDPRVLQQLVQYWFRAKVFFSYTTRPAPVPWVIRFDFAESGDRLLHVAEREQSFANGEPVCYPTYLVNFPSTR